MGGPLGLVLSGGGARGAYELGALLYVAEALPGLLERVRVITGSSAGAVNGVFLAGGGLTRESVERLADIWRRFVLDELISVSARNAASVVARVPLRLVGRRVPSPVAGMLDVGPLWRLVRDKTDWRGLHRTMRSGRLDAIAVAATDIATGHTHLFYEGRRGMTPHWSTNDPNLHPISCALRPHHVLASASIPILFPPVRVRGRWYMDGGLRYNTPLSPALSLGAESLLILSVRSKREVPATVDGFPGLGQVIGKLLDSAFLDRVAFDLDRLMRLNDVMEAVETLDEAAKARLQKELVKRARRLYRVVPFVNVRPGEDLGAMAADHLSRLAKERRISFARVLQTLLTDDAGTTGDAASFLLFDGRYADQLIERGRIDARALHDQLAAL